MSDPHDLRRFVEAQRGVYDTALAELRAGRKRSHWMWFVFPQIAGLGHSPMAQLYAIRSLTEARAYLAHPLLGPRLRACVQAANGHAGLPARALFGSPDDVKFRSSMTLFERAEPDEPAFREALAAFFDGEPDALTLARLESARERPSPAGSLRDDGRREPDPDRSVVRKGNAQAKDGP